MKCVDWMECGVEGVDWKVIGVKGIVGVYGVCIGWSGKWRSEVDGVWSELNVKCVDWMECGVDCSVEWKKWMVCEVEWMECVIIDAI